MPNRLAPELPARQRGATLIVALLILVLIMIIGITAVSTSNTQYKLAGNLQFEDSAINNAETGIATAELWLSTGTPPNYAKTAFTAVAPTTNPNPSAPGTPELLPRTNVASIQAARATAPLSMTWADSNSRCVGNDPAAPTVCGATGNPNQRYFIELMSLNNRLLGSSQAVGGRTSSGCNQVNTYLISARGASARGAVRFVQSYYSVLSCP